MTHVKIDANSDKTTYKDAYWEIGKLPIDDKQPGMVTMFIRKSKDSNVVIDTWPFMMELDPSGANSRTQVYNYCMTLDKFKGAVAT